MATIGLVKPFFRLVCSNQMDAIHLYVGKRDGDYRLHVMEPNGEDSPNGYRLVKRPEGELGEPTLILPRGISLLDAVDALLDAVKEHRHLTNGEERALQAGLTATKKHLEDMRKLVFIGDH